MANPWKKFDEPKPYPAVSGFAVDHQSNFVLLHRSNKVRSAKDVWSLPSGLHEIGLSFEEQLARELKEELNLVAYPQHFEQIGFYENIRPDGDGWHWFIGVGVIRVHSLADLVNAEPDKHDQVKIVHVSDLAALTTRFKFGSTLAVFIEKYKNRIRSAILNVADGVVD